MFQRKPTDEIYFLKTGNYLLPFRGYFKSKKKLKTQLHEILDASILKLIEEWERTHDKKWEKPRNDIISNEDMCHSVQVMRLSRKPQNFFASYFVMR